MLEGLEISEINKSDLERTLRIDSEFYSKENLEIIEILQKLPLNSITELVKVSDGNHMAISDKFSEVGVPYYRGQDIHQYFIEDSTPICIDDKSFDEPVMKRSHLKEGDVLLSIVGTIGGVSLVSSNEKATCSCKLAIFRPQSTDGYFLSAFLKSKYGQNQIKKFTRGAIQMGLILEDMSQIMIPKFSDTFQKKIRDCIDTAKGKSNSSIKSYNSAEILLLQTIGLEGFEPSADGINVKSLKDSFLATGRLDAEYYQKKFDILEKAIRSQNHKTIKEIRIDNYRGMQPIYVENGDLDIINSKHILEDSLDYNGFEKTSSNYWDIQSRARVYKGDILTYTTGANIGRTQVYQSDKKALASNHVNIIRIKEQNPVFIGFVLNSLVGRMQTDKFSAGSAQAELYPKDLDEFLIPIIENTQQEKIAALVEESFRLKKQSEQLLEIAKRAVEIAIEQDEEAAMRYIEQAQRASM